MTRIIQKFGLAVSLIFICVLNAHSQAPTGENNQHLANACSPDLKPDVLWSLAQVCAKDLKGNPDCRAYAKDESEEYVVIKDKAPAKPEGYLIIPVKCATGIEDSQIFSSSLVNLWEDAWFWSKKYPGHVAFRTGLAINSKNGRSLNQLHIHVSCVLPEVSKTLETTDVPADPTKAVQLQREHAKLWGDHAEAAT
jgi:CDP-diacylglycerol pyrophosphatase